MTSFASCIILQRKPVFWNHGYTFFSRILMYSVLGRELQIERKLYLIGRLNLIEHYLVSSRVQRVNTSTKEKWAWVTGKTQVSCLENFSSYCIRLSQNPRVQSVRLRERWLRFSSSRTFQRYYYLQNGPEVAPYSYVGTSSPRVHLSRRCTKLSRSPINTNDELNSIVNAD